MAPIRRYLRITKYSVLECRIYLDNPADAQRWLLNPRDPVLPRVIESVRPLVLPKLREENERGKGKGKKNKGVKDVVVEDEFEVSIFLTELSTRHSLLTKQKIFKDEGGKIKSNSGKMTGTTDVPIEVQDDTVPVVREESEEQEGKVDLEEIPAAEDIPEIEVHHESRQKRRRRRSEGLFLSDDSDFQTQKMPPSKRNKHDGKPDATIGETGDDKDDKKKMALSTAYDGFSIYGRILCLVVKRRGTVKGKQPAAGAGQAMMEEWIASTQVDRNDED
ncbi:MAG: hypothetical protein M1830_001148 [Pleopsidium flavum]|nr:MAG: hypothetical protein M1830_001148 [Pleopsidium flavum]